MVVKKPVSLPSARWGEGPPKALLAESQVDVQNRFGVVALELGFITDIQLREAIAAQVAAARAGLRRRLGDILIQRGVLTPVQVREILDRQRVEEGKQRVGNYEIVSKLGEGAMGAVYKARQVGMERLVALKILSPTLAGDPDFRERFVREARAVAALNHPHIVSGIDVGTDGGLYYLAMEFVDGESLADGLQARGGRMPEADALECCRQIALALHHAHANGILHRDVKPDNVLVNRRGVAKLADLGLVLVERTGSSHGREQGLAVGTPYYMSPEQARGLTRLTPATDLYSLGATLFHLVTGRPPYVGPTRRAILIKHVKERIPDPRKYNPRVSPATAAICVKLLQKDPAERYGDGATLAQDLQAACAGGSPKHAALRPSAKAATEETRGAAQATGTRRARPVRSPADTNIVIMLAIAGVLAILLGITYWVIQPGAGSRRPASGKTPAGDREKASTVPNSPAPPPARPRSQGEPLPPLPAPPAASPPERKAKSGASPLSSEAPPGGPLPVELP